MNEKPKTLSFGLIYYVNKYIQVSCDFLLCLFALLEMNSTDGAICVGNNLYLSVRRNSIVCPSIHSYLFFLPKK